MEESFKPLSVSVSQLFGDSMTLYRIPRYQRPYKWQNEQVEQLWHDIFEAYENNTENYFLGSIITAKSSDNGGYIDVVDGQQRLTTLMILFCVLRDNYKEINKNDTENPFSVDINAIKNVITLNNKSSRLRLFTHLNHQSEFLENILNEDSTLKHLPIPKNKLKNDQEPVFKFINTANIFKEKLESLEDKERGEFVNYLFHKVKLIRIDCTNRDFAIKLFQVLNDRGMDLTPADLVKSYLIGNLATLYKEDSQKLKDEENILITNWHGIEEILKNSDINLTELLTMYQYYLLANNPKRSLTEELEILFKKENPNTIVYNLKKFAKLYETEILNTKSKNIYSLKYIPWTMYWKSIVMTSIYKNYKYKNELLEDLNRFYYLYWIAGKTLSPIKQPSFNVIKAIKEDKHINYIRAIFKNKIEKDKILSIVKENLKSKEIDDEKWIKPLLALIEYKITDDSSFIKFEKDIQLEHILPKKYNAYNEWGYIEANVSNTWLKSIANLTLLSGEKNSEATNYPFDQKMQIYSCGATGNTTSFRISQHILDDFNNNKFGKKWNEDALKNRWNWIFNHLTKILNMDFSDLLDKEPN